MGKYMRQQNPKPAADVALGVKTRAKTLALKHKPDSSQAAGLSYLQLRSRRLVKPPVSAKKRTKRGIDRNAPDVQPNCKLVPNGVVEEEQEASFGENCLDCDDVRESCRNLLMGCRSGSRARFRVPVVGSAFL